MAESFNAKIKLFRANLRGVADKKFFLFRIAKVTRDRLMEEYDKVLPGYGFASNKGYGSAEHIAALKEIGPSPIHRQSFIGHFV